jgi:hypothetical protein
MEFINYTRMEAGYTLGTEPSGRDLLVVVVKGTFRIPTDQGARLQMHPEQVPLVTSDVFLGEPGISPTKYEAEFVPRKRHCDVLLLGHAYAPNARPVERLTAGLAMGGWSKSFSVVGDRVWYSAGGPRATAPAPFVTMPISYDHAFGGVDHRHEDPLEHRTYMANPSGRGFHQHLVSEWLEGSPLPNTEEVGAPVTQPDGRYLPMSLGAIGRHWDPRYRYAGTYDQRWREEVFPFLPADFDEQYYQSAPLDQQIPLPLGEQTVSLLNLTPDGLRDFRLPAFEAVVSVVPKRGTREEFQAPIDTIIIEPDEDRVTLAWRICRPLARDIFEIAQVLVGRRPPDARGQANLGAESTPIIVERAGAAARGIQP